MAEEITIVEVSGETFMEIALKEAVSKVVDLKGVKGLIDNRLSKTKQLFTDIEIKDYNNSTNYPNQYLKELSKIDGI